MWKLIFRFRIPNPSPVGWQRAGKPSTLAVSAYVFILRQKFFVVLGTSAFHLSESSWFAKSMILAPQIVLPLVACGFCRPRISLVMRSI